MELNVVVTKPTSPSHRAPIVFVHGAWHGAWCWTEHFTDFFADHGYPSYAVDLRGYGESDGDTRTTRIAHYVHDVRRVALELDAEPIIVGHSMGGLVTQQYLSQYRAAAGVLMAPVPVSGAIGATMRVIRDHPLAFLKTNVSLSLGPIVEDRDRAIALLFGPLVRSEDARRYVERLQDASYPAYLEMIFDLPRPSRVRDPMFVLGAQLDALFSPSEINATAGAYGTEATIFDAMGHDMMLEPEWERPAMAILKWLDNTTPYNQ